MQLIELKIGKNVLKNLELTQLRDYCIKHFELSNGKRKCIISSNLLHYFDNGNFKDLPELPNIEKIILTKEKTRHFLFEIPRWGRIELSENKKSFVVCDKKNHPIWTYQNPFVYSAEKKLEDYRVKKNPKKNNITTINEIDKKSLGAIDCEFFVNANSIYLKVPPNLKYPLKIDPTDITATNNKDSYLGEFQPTANHGTDTDFFVDKDEFGYRTHAVMEWTLPSDSGTITDIKLFLYQYKYTAYTDEGMNAEVHELLEGPFIENQVTWNIYSTGNNWTNSGAIEPTSASANDIDTVYLSRESGVWKTWILKGSGAENPVNWSWGNTEDIVIYDPTVSGDGDTYHFVSKEASGSDPCANAENYKPYLEITYGVAQSLISSSDAVSTVTGEINIQRNLSGDIQATSTIAGLLSGISLSGTINASSGITGKINVQWGLSGQISAISSEVAILNIERSIAGSADAVSSIIGKIDVQWELSGQTGAASSVSGLLGLQRPISGLVGASATVEGVLTKDKFIAGNVDGVSAVQGVLIRDRDIIGDITCISSLTGVLAVESITRGFYYSKLGTDNLINPPDTDFNVTIEHNGIASFDFVIQNNAANRTIIADHLTEDYTIMREDGTIILVGSIDSDRIEYFAEGEGGAGKRIRLSGYANFIDLAYLIYKRIADADAEAVGSVQDEDNSTATFTDYTTAANNDTINDVFPTFGAVNDALYIGKDETFFAAKIKYSTKGIQAANTTVVVEYSKGSGVWATLDCIDESYAFTEAAGTYLFYMPNKADDWAKDTINSKNQYYMRFRITQGSYSTLPKLDRIWLSNADVCRVQFNDVAANTILGYVLEGTGYSEDATDQCPSTAITMRGEYDSKLRWIFGIGSALTWEDGNGDKQRYDVWIDTANKTHFKQQRGTDKGDLSGDFRAVNNKMGYHGIGTRIFGAGGYDGINQKRAIVEDTSAQATHKLREIVLEDSRITTYEALKAETQKSLTIRKAPLKEVSGDIDTKYWLDNSLSAGDKITINQPDWNLNNQELYIMRAVIDPSNTHLDLGTSQMHLEHMRSSLQRQMDINNVWMHGAVSTYIAGPIVDNYQRVDDVTVYPVKMKIHIPNDVCAINKVKISWALSNFKSSAKASKLKDLGTKGSNFTDLGAKTSNTRTLNITDHGAITPIAGYTPDHNHPDPLHLPNGYTDGQGAHNHGAQTGNDLASHTHAISFTSGTGTAHKHPISDSGAGTAHVHPVPTTSAPSATASVASSTHTHTNPTTSAPSATINVVNSLTYHATATCVYGSLCVTGVNTASVASSTHTHTQGDTGAPSATASVASSTHTHTVGNTGGEAVHTHSIPDTGYEETHWHAVTGSTGGPSEAHQHSISGDGWHQHYIYIVADGGHTTTINTIDPLGHIADFSPGPEHDHYTDIGSHDHNIVMGSHEHGIEYGVHEEAGGTILELIVNGTTVANTYEGDQTDILITGWLSKGTNTVELQPKVGQNYKGRAEIFASVQVFVESK